MHEYTLVLLHPLFGYKVLDFGSFDKIRARILATKTLGPGYTLISMRRKDNA